MMYSRIECKDGFSMSVQASQYAYCTPREDGVDAYTHVEVGFPSEVEELLLPWVEDEEIPMQTVYGWVPAHIILAVISNHGGVVVGKLPPMKSEE